jgi:hypothetical protein
VNLREKSGQDGIFRGRKRFVVKKSALLENSINGRQTFMSSVQGAARDTNISRLRGFSPSIPAITGVEIFL